MLTPYPKFTLTEKLTEEQRRFFNENGFIHFQKFIEPEVVRLIINESIKVQENWIRNGVKKVNGVPIKYGRDLDGATIVQRFAFINQYSNVLSEFLQDSRFSALLELVNGEGRLGKDEKDGMVLNHYVNSPQSKFTKMGWHTDGLRDVFLGTKLNPMLNVGIHLSNLKPENGGLRIIPGTHRQGLYNLLFRKMYFFSHDEDPEELAIIPEAGDLTVHDGRLWHRVAQSRVTGEESRRRVIYVPIIAGEYQPKNEKSPTAFYQKFSGLVR